MIAWLSPPPAERRILPGSPLRSVTPWIVAVMSFTMLLVAACGLVTARAAGELGGAIGQRFVLTVPAGSGDSSAIARRVRVLPGVRAAEAVSAEKMRATLGRWLGPTAGSADLPIPALVKIEMADGADFGRLHKSLIGLVPGAQVSSYQDNVAPILSSLRLVRWIALALVVLLGAAASSAVVLAARGAIDSHRQTVDVLHGIGATDHQVTRLFQYRIAIDTLAGSLAGAAAAGAVMAAIAGGARWAAEISGLSLGTSDLIVLGALPFLLTIVATLAARAAILSALRESL